MPEPQSVTQQLISHGALEGPGRRWLSVRARVGFWRQHVSDALQTTLTRHQSVYKNSESKSALPEKIPEGVLEAGNADHRGGKRSAGKGANDEQNPIDRSPHPGSSNERA